MTTTTAPAAVLSLQQTIESTDIATLCHVGQGAVDDMSFAELDSFVNMGVRCIAGNRAQTIMAHKALVPAIKRIHDALSSQGKRTDLPDTPAGLTFSGWIKEKQKLSRSTIYRLLNQAGIPQKILPAGAKVRDIGSGDVGTVERAYTDEDGELRLEVKFKEDMTTFHARNVRKVPIRKVDIGDLFNFTDLDDGYLYNYEGNRKFARAERIQKSQKAKPKSDAKPKPRKGLALVTTGATSAQGVQ